MGHFLLCLVCIDLFDFRRQFPVAALVLGHEQTPDARKKTRHAFHAAHAPRFHLLQGSHKHLVAAKGVGPVPVDHIVRIHNVAARFRHFLIIFTQDDSLIDEALERLGLRDITEIEQHLLPEACIQQMQDSMLGAANVQIDTTRLLAAHPIALGLLSCETLIVVRIAESQIVPTRTGPLRHDVRLANRPFGVTNPIFCL